VTVAGLAARNGGRRIAAAPGTCHTCRHFSDSPRAIEAWLPGLAALGSVYGSVRSADGLCRLHDRYLAPASRCAGHESRDRAPADT